MAIGRDLVGSPPTMRVRCSALCAAFISRRDPYLSNGHWNVISDEKEAWDSVGFLVDIISLASTHSTGSGTKLLNQGWSFLIWSSPCWKTSGGSRDANKILGCAAGLFPNVQESCLYPTASREKNSSPYFCVNALNSRSDYKAFLKWPRYLTKSPSVDSMVLFSVSSGVWLRRMAFQI